MENQFKVLVILTIYKMQITGAPVMSINYPRHDNIHTTSKQIDGVVWYYPDQWSRSGRFTYIGWTQSGNPYVAMYMWSRNDIEGRWR